MFSHVPSILFIFIQILCLFIAIILHEIAHGYVANHYGDPTAKRLGRLSINPIRHIDPIGSIIVPGLLIVTGSSVLFGWAKPVPIQTQFFTRPSYHMMLVAIAGPVTNLTLAAFAGLFFQILLYFSQVTTLISPLIYSLLAQGIIYFIHLNIVLAVFNLIPIPPLDGSRVMAHFSPWQITRFLERIEPYGFLLVYLGLFTGIIPSILQFLVPPLTYFFLPNL